MFMKRRCVVNNVKGNATPGRCALHWMRWLIGLTMTMLSLIHDTDY